MSTQAVSAQEVRAAAEAYHELGPDYSDAVVASFLEKVDREIAARVDARLASMSPAPQAPPVQPTMPGSRHMLRTALVIGVPIWAIPALLIARSGSGGDAPIGRDELQWLLACWLVGTAIFLASSVVRVRRQSSSRRTAGS